MSSTDMRSAVEDAGFSLNNPLHQVLVARYSKPDLTIDFDNFVGCLVRLETMFDAFSALEKDGNHRAPPDGAALRSSKHQVMNLLGAGF